MARALARLALALPLAFAFGLTGACLKVGDDVQVAKDGSGSFVEDYVIDLKATEELSKTMADLKKRMGSMGGIPGMPGMPPGTPPGTPPVDDPPVPPPAMEGEPAPETPPAVPADAFTKVKDLTEKIEGLKVSKLERVEADGKSGFHLEATFTSLEAYARASQRGGGAELTKNEDGSYTLTFVSGFGPAGKKPRKPPRPAGGTPPAMEGEPPAMDGEPAPMEGEPPPGMDGADDPLGGAMGMGMMGSVMGMLTMFAPTLPQTMSGLEQARKLTLPGEILSTNGVRSEDGFSVSWKVGWKEYAEGKTAPETVTFKGEGLDLKPFRVAPHYEMAPKITSIPGFVK